MAAPASTSWTLRRSRWGRWFCGAAAGWTSCRGGSGDDQFVIDVTGLTCPANATDTVREVTVYVGGGTANQVIIEGLSQNVTQADLQWVNFPGGAAADYTLRRKNTAAKAGNFEDETITVATDLIYPGRNVTLEAGTVKLQGHTISTSASVAGNITLKGKHIFVDSGAQLLAEGGVAAQNGKISLLAIDNRAKITDERDLPTWTCWTRT